MIIAIDGQHRAGKSTIINNLKKYYENNADVVFIKYPTFTDIGNFAKSKVGVENDDVLSLLLAADLTSCYQKNIALESNKIYILDRYVLSLFTLQGGQNRENYQFLYNITDKIQYPDIQIVIHKKDQDISINNDPFVVAAKNMRRNDTSPKVYIVENILGSREHPNLEGFNEIKRIIDEAIEQ